MGEQWHSSEHLMEMEMNSCTA